VYGSYFPYVFDPELIATTGVPTYSVGLLTAEEREFADRTRLKALGEAKRKLLESELAASKQREEEFRLRSTNEAKIAVLHEAILFALRDYNPEEAHRITTKVSSWSSFCMLTILFGGSSISVTCGYKSAHLLIYTSDVLNFRTRGEVEHFDAWRSTYERVVAILADHVISHPNP
jgi:hypothetical protein